MIEHPVINQEISWSACSDNFRFAAAVAGYGMLLRNSEFKQETSYSKVIDWAENALGKDKEGYRSEFLKLVKASQLMAKELLSVSEK
jgi:Ca-activated chloride channel family protein